MLKRIIVILGIVLYVSPATTAAETFFRIQSIDTMKFSRDEARLQAKNPDYDKEIETQMRDIAKTGATHVAIGTPYDEEFVPYMKRWVEMARRYNLKIWFRGNFSGWEGWFDYKPLDRTQHTALTVDFIKNHKDLFADGDLFSSCPECENGGPGDPRQTGDVDGHRKFLIEEYEQVKTVFKQVNLKVEANFYAMNADVAKLIMDKETTKAMDGIVTIDHYIESPEQYKTDIWNIAYQSGGKVVLGEFGAPVPDIHGDMTEEEQAAWIEKVMKELIKLPQIEGVNYWVNRGGTTRIWSAENQPRQAVQILTTYFRPKVIYGKLKNEIGLSLSGVTIKSDTRSFISGSGSYEVPILDDKKVAFSKEGYIDMIVNVNDTTEDRIERDIVLNPQRPSWLYNILKRVLLFFMS